MELRCETCGAENPASNRFCGQCGIRLQPAAGRTSGQLWPQSISHFDNPPPGLVGQFDHHPEAESELHNQIQQEGEIHSDIHAAQGLEPDSREQCPPPNSRDAAAAGILDLPLHEPPANRTGVSGPSFLGLTDDYPPRYYDDVPEPQSHLRRNLALAIVAVVIFLVTLQWRSVRDYGLAYVQNGSMQVPTRKLPRNSPAIAADNVNREPAPPPAQAAPGAPQPVENSPNRLNHAYGTNSGTSDKSKHGSAQAPAVADSADQPQPLRQAASTSSASASAVPGGKPASMSAPPPTAPAVSSASGSADNVVGNPSPPAKPRPFHTATVPPGSDEMRRAADAADAQSRATWLWRAVGKGNPQAPVELARMYEQGSGVARNCDQAQLLLRAAAARGNQQAKLSLHEMLSRGGCSPH